MKLVDKKASVKRQCPMCGKITTIEVSELGYLNWKGGKLIQDALPELGTAKRETLISGFCVSCQTVLFGGDEECVSLQQKRIQMA